MRSSADGVRVVQSYAGKALKTTHVGAYEGLSKTHDQLLAYMAAHGYTRRRARCSLGMSMIRATRRSEKLRTEMYAVGNASDCARSKRACPLKSCAAQHVARRAADAIALDDRGEFEAQAHRLGDLCLPAKRLPSILPSLMATW